MTSLREAMDGLVSLFSHDDDAGPKDLRAHLHPEEEHPAEAPDPEQFADSLVSMLQDHSNVVAGRVHMIGLDAIQEAVGPEWDMVKGAVYAVAKRVIAKHMNRHDLFRPYLDTKFALVFATLDPEEAKLKAALIAEEINEVILGKKGVDETLISVDTAAIKENGKLSFERIDDAEPLVQEISKMIPEAPMTRTDLNKVLKARGQQPIDESGVAKGSAGTADQEQASDPFKLPKFDIKMQFQPMWFTKRNVISAFECLPTLAMGPAHRLVGYNVLADQDDEEAILDLDIKAIEVVAREVIKLLQEGQLAVLYCPVHYNTLAGANNRRRYQQICSRLDKRIRKYIVLEINRIPLNLPGSRLSDLLSHAKPFCRAVTGLFPLRTRNFSDYANTEVFAVGSTLRGYSQKPEALKKEITAFIEAARNAGLRYYFHRVPSPELAEVAKELGADYISGDSLMPLVEHAHGMQPFHGFTNPD